MKRACSYLLLTCVSIVIGCASSQQSLPSQGGVTAQQAVHDGPGGLSAHDQKLLNTLRDMRAAHNRHDFMFSKNNIKTIIAI